MSAVYALYATPDAAQRAVDNLHAAGVADDRITIATFAAMTLLHTLFSKFVPIISIWELKVGEQEPHETAQERSARVLGEARP